MKPKKVYRGSLLERYRVDVSRCVKCGACRAVCPSFLRDRAESRSARGRMALVKAILDGRLTVSGVYQDRLASCTGCLACEASCPSGVPVTEIIQAAKEQAVAEAGRGIIGAVLSGVLMRPGLFRSAAWLTPVVLHYAKGTGKSSEFRVQSSEYKLPSSKKKSLGRVAFFPGCAVDYFQPEIGTATIGVLNKLGYEVIVPNDLKCCGRPLLTLGDREAAEKLAAHNTGLLARLDADAVVTACASCSLTFKKEYPKLLRSGTKPPEVLDIHEFLASRISGLNLGPINKRITWHDPCHLGRGQGLSGAARDILRSVPGLTLTEMSGADRCCGFGGVMRITHRSLSDGIAEEKARAVIATEASAVVTGCPACRMQITNALKHAGAEIEVLHTVQVLEEALSNAECGIGSHTASKIGASFSLR
jgi:glycolate dehydrogenase iron-sulfur subunit